MEPSLVGRSNWLDASILLKLHWIDAHLAMEARSVFVIEIGGIDAMIHDIPLILARNLEHTIMSSSIDFLIRTLLQDNRLLGHLDRT